MLQRLAVPGSGGELGVGFVLCFAAFLYGIFKGLLVLSPQRIVLYCVATSALLLTLFARTKEFSLLSLPMLLILYVPYTAVAPMAREDYVKLLRTFQTVVLFCAACALVQFLIQFPLGANAMFPLDLVLRNCLYGAFRSQGDFRWFLDARSIPPGGPVATSTRSISSRLSSLALGTRPVVRGTWNSLHGIVREHGERTEGSPP